MGAAFLLSRFWVLHTFSLLPLLEGRRTELDLEYRFLWKVAAHSLRNVSERKSVASGEIKEETSRLGGWFSTLGSTLGSPGELQKQLVPGPQLR